MPRIEAPASLRGYKRPVFRPAPVREAWWRRLLPATGPSFGWASPLAQAAAILAVLFVAGGGTLVASANSQRAVQLLRKDRFDVIITDIYMPDQDGLEILRDSRSLCPGTPVIAMSGFTGRMNMLAAATMLGAAATLKKPISPDQLLAAIGTALAQAGK
jgi:CheY-like chemotaxis protein